MSRRPRKRRRSRSNKLKLNQTRGNSQQSKFRIDKMVLI